MSETLTPAPASPSTEPASKTIITARLCRAGSDRCESIPLEQVGEMVRGAGNLLWIDLQDPGPAEFERLHEKFGFHRLALEDAAKQQQRPKVDEYPGYFFIVLYAPVAVKRGDQVRTVELDLFVGPNYLVSLHRGRLECVADAGKRWDRTDPELRHQVGFLVHTLVDTLIDAYFPVVDHLEDELDSLEIRMFQRNSKVSPEHMIAVKRSLYVLRRAVYPMREVFNAFLRRDNALFSAETYPYFQDVYDHVLRLLDIVDIQRDMASGVLDAHLAVISNRLNETMQKLTVVATCMAFIGTVSGAWGMNVDHIPLQHAPNAFWYIVGGTLGLTAIGLAWAKKRELW